MVGIETRARVARMAAAALGGDAEIFHATAPEGLPTELSAVLMFDVLHLLKADEQERLVAAVFDRVEPGGTALVRDVDAAGGWGFQAVRLGNRLKNIAVGRPWQPFHFRTEAGWADLFTRTGWVLNTIPMNQGTPFANVLFHLVKPATTPVDEIPEPRSS